MGHAPARQLARHSGDLYWKEDEEAVRRHRRRRRKQIRHQLGCLGFLVAALTAWAAGPTAPFSHKIHAPLKLNCAFCHSGAAKAERAGFPKATTCRTCHTSFPDDAKFPAQRVYRLADYVFFSHASHVNAKVDCARCHGPVNERPVLTKEVDHTMKACVDCHKEHKATVVCTACHELGQ
ncbi:MAG: cytochrome c3 family protein [Acidimicrobiia bacterium]|nr:cytochrome c3 family protein [Acidimicrobiia bacterium]